MLCGYRCLGRDAGRGDPPGSAARQLFPGWLLKRRRAKGDAGRLGDWETGLRQWCRQWDLLPGLIEYVITIESSLDDTVRAVVADTELDGGISHALGGRTPQRLEGAALGVLTWRVRRSWV